MADETESKLKRHIMQMLPRKEQIPHQEREHFVRHFKGMLSTVGELVEEELLKRPT